MTRRMQRKAMRVAWIPLVTTLGALALAFGFVTVTEQSTESFRSELVLLVPATPPNVEPVTPPDSEDEQPTTTVFDPLGRPTEALRAASNYANVIPQDAQVRAAVAAAARMPEDDVDGRIVAAAVPDSSLIVVTFDAPTAEASEAGVAALEQAVTGDTLVTRAIQPGSLIVVSRAEPQPVGGGSLQVLVSALVLGAAFGVFLAFVWTRSNSRVDGPQDLEDLSDAPVVELQSYSAPAAGLVRRTIEIAREVRGVESESGPDRVAVAAVDGPSSDGARRAVDLLIDSQVEGTSGGHEVGNQPVAFVYAGRAGAAETAPELLDAASVVLSVQSGRRVAAVRDALGVADRLGLEVVAVVILPQASGSIEESRPPAPPPFQASRLGSEGNAVGDEDDADRA